MKNREALFPNRIKFTDEDTGKQYIGTWDYADSPTEVGTKLTADVFLSNDNAAEYGIESEDPTPNEVFTVLSRHASRHASDGTDPIAPADIGAEAARLQFVNISAPAAAFIEDTIYENFPYRAAVALTGVTANMVPEVVFGVAQATSGIFAPVAETYDGGIYLYAAEIPEADITIPTITCWKAVG